MPTVPPVPFNPSGYSQSPMMGAKPSQTDLLMAAADMHSEGKLVMPQGPERPKVPSRKVRKLKVVK